MPANEFDDHSLAWNDTVNAAAAFELLQPHMTPNEGLALAFSTSDILCDCGPVLEAIKRASFARFLARDEALGLISADLRRT